MLPSYGKTLRVMARHESHREDLLAEATALVERVEFAIAGEPEPVVVGFRRNGAAGIYFGQDTAYQFNADGELRRAFIDDRLYKADRGRLASLDRQRTDEEVQLVRHDLDAPESKRFLDEMQQRVRRLGQALASGQFQLLRQASEGGDVTPRIIRWLEQLPATIEVARSPRAG
jgi:hypothetical protein